jgi:hypothetical protein
MKDEGTLSQAQAGRGNIEFFLRRLGKLDRPRPLTRFTIETNIAISSLASVCSGCSRFSEIILEAPISSSQ